ncbi:MAG: hypothetical protein KF817_07590 [Phycisphaeraceae bacterium]|nr:hypothetical protein [Phycisphaeraceae bacterium]
MRARGAIAVEFEKRRVRLVRARRDGSILRIAQVIVETIPAEIEREDGVAVGRWLRGLLKAQRIPRLAATAVIPREQVGLKRLVMPTTEADELPEMVRLSMQRELPFDPASAVIDFVPVAQESASTVVVAAGVPRSLLEWTRTVLREAGLKLERATLRSMGIAALLRTCGTDQGPSLFAVELTDAGAEFCVVEEGSVRFSRGADVARAGTDIAVADALVTEARRTWMSFRFADGTGDVPTAVVLGPESLTRLAAPRIGEALQIVTEVLRDHPLVDGGAADIDRVWPLAGVLLESLASLEKIDFLHPRRPVDRRAQRRRRVMMAAGAALVVMLGAWTAVRRDLGALERERARLESQLMTLAPIRARFDRDVLRLRHIDAWTGTGVDWLGHLDALAGMLPAREDAVLDAWTGSAPMRGVEYDRRDRRWSAPRPISIVLEGEARTRAHADAVRDRLVAAPEYRARSGGADAAGGRRLAYRFTYELSTDRSIPGSAAPSGSPAPSEPPDGPTAPVDDAPADAAGESAP